MANELIFNTETKLSPSDFGSPILSKNNETGAFRSFGIVYGADGSTLWSNNEVWYKAWIAGLVMPGSITIKEQQRVRNVLDAAGAVVIKDGRKVTEAVEGEKVWQLMALKTKTQLENEDDIEVWGSLRSITKKQRVLEAHSKYEQTAIAAATTAVLSEDQLKTINEKLSQYGL
jgi:hypothetical protein